MVNMSKLTLDPILTTRGLISEKMEFSRADPTTRDEPTMTIIIQGRRSSFIAVTKR
jgi:hypothetical protein